MTGWLDRKRVDISIITPVLHHSNTPDTDTDTDTEITL